MSSNPGQGTSEKLESWFASTKIYFAVVFHLENCQSRTYVTMLQLRSDNNTHKPNKIFPWYSFTTTTKEVSEGEVDNLCISC